MSTQKIVLLLIYAALIVLALVQGGEPAGIWSLRILAVLVVVHAIEVLVFFRTCQAAGGSLPGHLLNVFLFGVIHVRELKTAAAGG